MFLTIRNKEDLMNGLYRRRPFWTLKIFAILWTKHTLFYSFGSLFDTYQNWENLLLGKIIKLTDGGVCLSTSAEPISQTNSGWVLWIRAFQKTESKLVSRINVEGQKLHMASNLACVGKRAKNLGSCSWVLFSAPTRSVERCFPTHNAKFARPT